MERQDYQELKTQEDLLSWHGISLYNYEGLRIIEFTITITSNTETVWKLIHQKVQNSMVKTISATMVNLDKPVGRFQPHFIWAYIWQESLWSSQALQFHIFTS